MVKSTAHSSAKGAGQSVKTVLIVGGGFAGVRCAQELARKSRGGVRIRLVSSTPHFEYHAALYRIVTGRNPLEVCIPLVTIFRGTDVELVQDTIVQCDLESKRVTGSSGSSYSYDTLVLALGSQTDFYHTPGLEQRAFVLKTTTDALKLKRHIHETLASCGFNERHEQVCKAQFVIVGGGPTGVELAGELAVYMRQVAHRHKIDPSMITIDLIQSPSRLVPQLPEHLSLAIEKRLRSLGVNLYFNRRILKSTAQRALVEGVQMKTSTIIWAAGVKAHSLYQETSGLQTGRGGRVLVTPHLRAQGQRDVYIAGDGADTPFSGMASTAFYDGELIAQTILAEQRGTTSPPYQPHQPGSAVPIGPGWAAVAMGKLTVFGRVGWWIRRAVDWYVFASLLPLSQAFAAFQSGRQLVESCPVCSEPA